MKTLKIFIGMMFIVGLMLVINCSTPDCQGVADKFNACLTDIEVATGENMSEYKMTSSMIEDCEESESEECVSCIKDAIPETCYTVEDYLILEVGIKLCDSKCE